MGEPDAPSVPTYCSTYRARCCGEREAGPCHQRHRPLSHATRGAGVARRSSPPHRAPGGRSPGSRTCDGGARRQLRRERRAEPGLTWTHLALTRTHPCCTRHVTSSRGEQGRGPSPRTAGCGEQERHGGTSSGAGQAGAGGEQEAGPAASQRPFLCSHPVKTRGSSGPRPDKTTSAGDFWKRRVCSPPPVGRPEVCRAGRCEGAAHRSWGR